MGRISIADRRRAEILDAFHACAVREGLNAASIKKIAARAGVPPSLIHHYFKDRNEMIEELVIMTADMHMENFRNAVGRVKSPHARFRKAVNFLFGPDMFNDDSGSLFYDFWSEGKRNQKVARSFSRVYEKFRNTVVELLEEADMAAGTTPSQRRDLATIIIALYEGLYVQWDFDRGNVPLKRVRKTAAAMIEAYLNGAQRADSKK